MKSLLLSLSLVFGLSTYQQNAPSPVSAELSEALIVVVNTADWCPLCQKHGERVEKDILSKFQANASYQIIVNDLSTEESKAASQEILMKAGLHNFSAENNGTGRIYFVHPTSKQVLDKISVSKSTEKISKAFTEALENI
ncbi:hypothetical protein [Croceimicrobium sp.]|uniref:hypothetical protein n=1 Tax=Croceimicrobium sp. TaxID=2828340 RepID=UPI003BAA1382